MSPERGGRGEERAGRAGSQGMVALKKVTELPRWQDAPPGGILVDAGNAVEYHTGAWRTKRPIWHPDRCTSCMICWMFCPDMAIEVKNRKMQGIDRDHCKGCGICANKCPTGALTMEPGGQYESAHR